MEIRTHTPDSKSITLLVIRDRDGKAISYVSISGSSTLVTVEKFGYTVKDETEKNAVSQEMKMKKTSQQMGQDHKEATRIMWERRQARWAAWKKAQKKTRKVS